jgi:hypothetical protein
VLLEIEEACVPVGECTRYIFSKVPRKQRTDSMQSRKNAVNVRVSQLGADEWFVLRGVCKVREAGEKDWSR